MDSAIVSTSPVPSVRWNSLERQTGKLSTHHHETSAGGGCGSSSATSLLQIGGATTSRPARSGSSSSSTELGAGGQQTLQLLSVPQPHSPLEEVQSGEGTSASSNTASRFRRYSCNPPGKGLTSSPQPHLRRSSLAAIKWSVLARRISMGMAHEREPPQDPTQVFYSFPLTFIITRRSFSFAFACERHTKIENDHSDVNSTKQTFRLFRLQRLFRLKGAPFI